MTGRLAAVIGGIVVFAGMTQTLVVGVVGIIGLAMIFYGIYKLTRKKVTINTTEKIRKMKTLRQISDRNDTLFFFRRADFLIPFAIVTALIISVSVASAVDLERGLVAYYSFDDCSAKDLSGNGNDGIIYGAKCVDGKFGNALRFDGVDDYVQLERPIINDLDEWTLMAWINVEKGDSDNDKAHFHVIYGEFAQSWTTKNFIGLQGSEEDGTLVFFPAFDNYPPSGSPSRKYWDDIKSKATIQQNKWYHIAVSKKKDSICIWYQGDFVVCHPYEVYTGAAPTKFWIGKRELSTNWEDYVFNGILDEVRIYNRALSEEEIKALYERGVTPRPKLAIEMDIDTSLKQGEVRKGSIRVENIGNSDAKSVKVRLFSEGLGIDVEKSYAKIPSGEAREFLFEVSANEAGTFKLSAYAEYRDDKGNKYVETAEKSVHVEAVVLPTSQPTSQAQETPEARETARPAGFYAIFASLLMAVSYFLIRLKGKKN